MAFSLSKFMDTAGAGIHPPSGKNVETNVEEYELFLILLAHPDDKIKARDITDRIKLLLGKDRIELNILDTLRALQIMDFPDRSKRIGEVLDLAKQMFSLSQTHYDEQLGSELRTQADQMLNNPSYARMLLIAFYRCFTDSNPAYFDLLRRLSHKQSMMLLQRLTRILKIHPHESAASAMVQSGTVQLMPESNESSSDEAEGEPSLADEVNSLKEKIRDYESYIHQKELEIEQLTEQAKLAQDNSQNDSELITRIGQQGILDYFYKAAKLRTKYRREKTEIPEDMQSVLMTISSFLKLMQDYGLSSMHEIGEQLQIREEEAAKFEFELDFQNKFSESVEEKTIEIATPGWKFRDQVIVRPKAQER